MKKFLLYNFKQKVHEWPFVLGLLVGLIAFVIPILSIDFTTLPGDLGDLRFNAYLLEHNYKNLIGNYPGTYWDAPFMYPEPNVMAYSDNLIGTAPLYIFFRLFGLKMFTAFQLWFFVLAILNYAAAYRLFMYLSKNKYLAVIAALIFAFSIALHSQIGHAQMLPRFMIPIAVLWAIRYVESYSLKYFFLSILALVYQFYCGIYLGFMLVFPLGLILFWGFIRFVFSTDGRKRTWSYWLMFTGAVALNGLGLLAFMQPYLKMQQSLKRIDLDKDKYLEVLPTIPEIKSFVLGQQNHTVWKAIFPENASSWFYAWWDHQIFPGGIAILCFVSAILMLCIQVFAKRWREKIPRHYVLLTIVGLLTFLVFLRINDTSAYYYLHKVPGFSALRTIGRIVNIHLLFFGVSTLYVFHFVLRRTKKVTHVIVFMALLILFYVDNAYLGYSAYTVNKKDVIARTQPLEEAIKDLPRYSVISFESNIYESEVDLQLDAMLSAQKYNLYAVNGYTARAADGFAYYWGNPNVEHREHWLDKIGIHPDTLYVIDSAFNVDTVYYKN